MRSGLRISAKTWVIGKTALHLQAEMGDHTPVKHLLGTSTHIFWTLDIAIN